MKAVLKYLLTSALVISSGCTTVAATQGYRPSGSTNAPIQISGELFDFTNIKIFIDGSKVIDKRLSLLSGDGEFQANFRNMVIAASCSQSTGLLESFTKCIVFIDNERAATLTF